MKGVCFKEPLYYAIVEGRKTMTRRIMNPQPDNCVLWYDEECPEFGFRAINVETGEDKEFKPRYRVGEVIYLKEPYKYLGFLPTEERCFVYKFSENGRDWERNSEEWHWENKLFMPAAAARSFIKITDVRAERLQDISDEDCVKEGVDLQDYKNMSKAFLTPQAVFGMLIDKINGRGTWKSNLWVWAYEFERVEG